MDAAKQALISANLDRMKKAQARGDWASAAAIGATLTELNKGQAMDKFGFTRSA